MAAVSGPSLNTDGVVFSLDASSPNCWNAGVSTAFVDNVNSHQGFPINDLYHSDGPFVDAGYVEFDGTGDYLSISSASSLGGFSGDFTIEFWFKGDNQTGFDVFLESWVSSTSSSQKWAIQAEGSGTTNMIWVRDGLIKFTTSGIDAFDNAWHHHAVVRNGSTINYYIDGVSRGSESHSASLSSGTDFIIGAFSSGGYGIEGYLSNVRIVDGTAVYTSNFTPPTKSLTAVTNTKLLTCQGNTIVDASSSAHTITTEGDAAAKLGSPSYFEFDGTSDFIDFPASADFALGTGNFTIELWMNSGVNSNDTFYRRMYMTDGPTGNASGNLQIAIEPSTGKVNLWENSGDLNLLGTSNITNSTWNHIVAVRLGSTLKIYVNGVEESSTTYSTSVTANSGSPRPRIGNYSGGGGTGDYSGKISNFKIYKGTGLSPKQIRQNYNALKSRFA